MTRKAESERARLRIEFGNKCQKCGFDQCLAALQFHHKDPFEKKMWSKSQGGASVKEIHAYPERFSLLCANCHIEVHYEMKVERRVFVTCKECGVKFRTDNYKIGNGRAIYCSRKCHHATSHPRGKTGPRPKSESHYMDMLYSRIEKTDKCWLWSGSIVLGIPVQVLGESGTPMARRSVPRVLIELELGKSIKKTRIYRICSTENCVRPDHYSIGKRPFGHRASRKNAFAPKKSRAKTDRQLYLY